MLLGTCCGLARIQCLFTVVTRLEFSQRICVLLCLSNLWIFHAMYKTYKICETCIYMRKRERQEVPGNLFNNCIIGSLRLDCSNAMVYVFYFIYICFQFLNHCCIKQRTLNICLDSSPALPSNVSGQETVVPKVEIGVWKTVKAETISKRGASHMEKKRIRVVSSDQKVVPSACLFCYSVKLSNFCLLPEHHTPTHIKVRSTVSYHDGSHTYVIGMMKVIAASYIL